MAAVRVRLLKGNQVGCGVWREPYMDNINEEINMDYIYIYIYVLLYMEKAKYTSMSAIAKAPKQA